MIENLSMQISRESLLEELKALYSKKAAKIGLIGQPGAGKTHLVSLFFEKLNRKLTGGSPTFSYANHYTGSPFGIVHFDLYRVLNLNHLDDLGIWEVLADNNSFCLIEWVDMFPEVRKECDHIIEIHLRDKERIYQFYKG